MKPSEELIIDYIKTKILDGETFTIDYIDDESNNGFSGLNIKISISPHSDKLKFKVTYLELLTFIYKQNKL